jgi:hypothetical protein
LRQIWPPVLHMPQDIEALGKAQLLISTM